MCSKMDTLSCGRGRDVVEGGDEEDEEDEIVRRGRDGKMEEEEEVVEMFRPQPPVGGASSVQADPADCSLQTSEQGSGLSCSCLESSETL